MAFNALGAVTVATPGTKVQITVNQQSPSAPIRCQSLLFQAFSNQAHTNVGRVYVFLRDPVLNTYTRVASLAVPTDNSIPAFSCTIPDAPGPLLANLFFVDADSAADGCDVSYLGP